MAKAVDVEVMDGTIEYNDSNMEVPMDVNSNIEYPNDNMGEYMEEENGLEAGLTTQAILYIVIAICAVLGITLGIFRGRKAAYK